MIFKTTVGTTSVRNTTAIYISNSENKPETDLPTSSKADDICEREADDEEEKEEELGFIE